MYKQLLTNTDFLCLMNLYEKFRLIARVDVVAEPTAASRFCRVFVLQNMFSPSLGLKFFRLRQSSFLEL